MKRAKRLLLTYLHTDQPIHRISISWLTKGTLEKKWTRFYLSLNLKDVIFYKYICKMYKCDQQVPGAYLLFRWAGTPLRRLRNFSVVSLRNE